LLLGCSCSTKARLRTTHGDQRCPTTPAPSISTGSSRNFPSAGRRTSSRDLHIKSAKVQGEFVWHRHEHTDELFLVHKGTLTIRYRDRDVVLRAGEMHVVPKGVEHKPVADEECQILLIEPAGTLNTGDAGGDLTASQEPWI
jgi:mannose-6-phosphate isomerase-like protein (cupin superfamily)